MLNIHSSNIQNLNFIFLLEYLPLMPRVDTNPPPSQKSVTYLYIHIIRAKFITYTHVSIPTEKGCIDYFNYQR